MGRGTGTRAAPDRRTTEPHRHARYFLNVYALAARLIAALDAPNIRLQFDLWHAARCNGDVAAVWATYAAQVTRVQAAGCPPRHEPGPVQCAFLRGIRAGG